MKSWMLLTIAVVLGTAAGAVFTAVEFYDSLGSAHQIQIDRVNGFSVQDLTDTPRPQVIVEGGQTHDFGVMQLGIKKSHTFKFRNAGKAALFIETKSTTCKCTISKLEQDVILPGQVADVTLEWTVDRLDPIFQQRAEIGTNDLEKPIVELSIRGRVLQSVIAVPSEITLNRLSSSKPHTVRIVLYSYDNPDLQIVGNELLNAEAKEYFTVKTNMPVTADELNADPDVKHAVAVQVNIKAGLPLGAVQQKIRLTTNVDEPKYVDLPIQGNIVSDISIVGPKFHSENNLLRIGPIKAEHGTRQQLYVIVKGPYRDAVRLSLGKVDPSDVLRVTLSDRTEAKSGRFHKYPLIIYIPPGSPPTSRRGTQASHYGEIEIETTHPEAQKVRVYIDFAVQG